MPPPYMRGHVRAPNKDHLIDLSARRHRFRNQAVQALTAPDTWDSRTSGIIPAVQDQGSCGSCWDFSGTGVVNIALIKAGILTVGQTLSESYILDCVRSGGCNGDDNTTVLAQAKSHGMPLTGDYGDYRAHAGTCKWKSGMKLYQITDWGFADAAGGQGVTPVADIKKAIMAYGCVGCAVAAGGSWDGYKPGTVHHGNSRGIDHDVVLTGWQDDASLKEGGWWWMRNSWGTGWGEAGYMRIAYGADAIGTEAVFAFAPGQDPIDW